MNEVNTSSAEPSSSAEGASWERDLIQKALLEGLAEQRKTRRWNLVFRVLLLGYLGLFLVGALAQFWMAPSAKPHTALVEVRGVISDASDANADRIISGLRRAFEDDKTRGVILRINSPGGSPVQAGYINDEIHRLREKYPQIPVYAVITDICASGGYYIAAAAKEIYADKASLVGSIGARMDGFGFVGTMEKLGVERRLLTAGDHKGMLDPFSPAKPEEIAHVEGLLGKVHEQFISVVKKGRKDKIKDEKTVFSGLVWTGEQSIELGLVDGLGSSSYVARELIKADTIVDYTPSHNVLDRISKRFGVSVMEYLGAMGGFK